MLHDYKILTYNLKHLKVWWWFLRVTFSQISFNGSPGAWKISVGKSCPLGFLDLSSYTVQLEGFFFSIPSRWGRLFTHCNPTQGSTETLPVFLWHAHCDPSAVPGGITVGYKTLILSAQVKQGVIHPTAIPLRAPQKPYLYFHCSVPTEMGRLPVGLEILIFSSQFYCPLGWVGNWKKKSSSCTVIMFLCFLCIVLYKQDVEFYCICSWSLRFHWWLCHKFV